MAVLGVLLSATLAAQQPGDPDPFFNADTIGTWTNQDIQSVAPFGNPKVFGFLKPGPNNTMWVAGLGSIGGTNTGGLARLDHDAVLDTTFSIQGAISPIAMVVRPDSSIVVALYDALRGYSPTGAPLSAFNIPVPTGMVRDLAIQPDGKVIVAGAFSHWNGVQLSVRGLVRLHLNGTRDTSFNPYQAGLLSFPLEFNDVEVLPNGTIAATGDFLVDMPGTTVHSACLIGFLPDGSLDLTYTPTGTGMPNGGAARFYPWPTGQKHLIMNGGTSFEGTPVSDIFLVDSLGDLDLTVSPSLGDSVHAYIGSPVLDCAIYPDGRMLFVGEPPVGAPFDAVPMLRVFPDGAIDSTFKPGDLFIGLETTRIESVMLGPNGSIYCSGRFGTSNCGAYRSSIMKMDSTGALDPDHLVGPGFNGPVNDIVQLPDGRYLVGGHFTTYRGQRCRRLACLTPSGALDTTFHIGTGLVPSSQVAGVYDLLVQPDGKILVAGDFVSYNGVPRTDLLRLEPDGTLDLQYDPFGPGSSYNDLGQATCMALQADGKLVVVGDLEWSAYQAKGIVRLMPDGSRDAAFDHGTGFIPGPRTVAIRSDGGILCGGVLNTFNGVPVVQSCELLNPDGSMNTSFGNTGTLGINGPVFHMMVKPDDHVIIQGGFTSIDTHASFMLGSLDLDGEPDVSFIGQQRMEYTGKAALQPDGRIIGPVASYGGVVRQGVARIYADGQLDTSFGIADTTWDEFANNVNVVLIDAQGDVLVGGSFHAMRGQRANGLIRLHNDLNLSAPSARPTEGASRTKAWPNPATGPLTIAVPTEVVKAEVSVHNALGCCVHMATIQAQNGTVHLDLSTLPDGAYIIRLNGGRWSGTARVVLARP